MGTSKTHLLMTIRFSFVRNRYCCRKSDCIAVSKMEFGGGGAGGGGGGGIGGESVAGAGAGEAVDAVRPSV